MQATQDVDLATNDLGPLAWVLDELRKSLESSSSALRRFVRDAAAARGEDMASVDDGQLRIARQHMHQAVGALEMVGLGAPAHMLRCMEAAVQRFVERPDTCTEAAAGKIDRAGFALTEYLEQVLLGKPVSAVALFMQYKDVQELAGADRAHPADLWVIDWRWIEPQTPAAPQAVVYDPAVRSRMDQAVLSIIKSGDAQAARELADTSLALAQSQQAQQPRVFWKICAGYFEAFAANLLPADVYAKRAASRVLLQYASLAKGEAAVSDRLAQDLVFFCAQAVPPDAAQAPLLAAVRAAYDLARYQPVDYSHSPFGRFDPALLHQARKRIAGAKETWSALSGGDAKKLKGVGEQFAHLGESLVKLQPSSTPLAQAMNEAIDTVVKSGRPPNAELAMEVATSVLYLEAALQDLDPDEMQMASRTQRLAQRLDEVRQGGRPQPFEPWMEELYRRVSDRQTMGSVVGELRSTMGELEKLLDQFFRDPMDKTPLAGAPNHLAQMRGVLSVLGLDQAADAVQAMREAVEDIIDTEITAESARAAGTFDKLGDNLGVLGFLIDMLNYQPTLAKKLFAYDDATRDLRPLMGRTGSGMRAPEPAPDALSQQVLSVVSEAQASGFADLGGRLGSIATHAALAENKSLAQAAREAAAAVAARDDEAAASAFSQLESAANTSFLASLEAPAAPAAEPVQEEDLRDIFLDEAREVIGQGHAAVYALATTPSDAGELTALRRAFHTLKGSSRMVALTEFGDAAWSLEQLVNTWLADQQPANDDLLMLAEEALTGFGRWVEDIAQHTDGAWKASMFRGPADAMRNEHRLVALALPGAAAPAPAAAPAEPVVEQVPADAAALELPSFEEPPAPAPAGPTPHEPVEAAHALDALPDPFEDDYDLPSFDLSGLPPAREPAPAPAAEPVMEPVLEQPVDEPVMEHVGEPLAAVPELDITEELPASFESPPAPLPEVAAAEADLSFLDEEAGTRPEAEPDFELELGTLLPVPPPAGPPPEIAGIDFDSLSSVAGPAAVEAAPVPAAPLPVHEEPVQEEPVHEEPVHAQALAEEAARAEAERDDQTKVIGSLRIGIPLYNVYLNEADEWSRRLVTEVGEWAMDRSHPVPESTVGWAHALAGSSATVGFHALSGIARALEHAMEHAQALEYCTHQHGEAFNAAAEEIRRLLHQFAAGFLKEPDPQVLRALEAVQALDIPLRADQRDSGPMSLPQDTEPAALAPQEAQQLAPEPEPEPEPEAAAVAPTTRHTIVERTEDDDIDAADLPDADLFPIFEEEGVELMPQLGGALRQWNARPDNHSARDEALRVLHTLKGSARLAGALRLGEMAHRLEAEIEYLGADHVNPADLEDLLQRYDAMQARFEALRASAAAGTMAAPAPVQPAAQALLTPLPETPATQAPAATPVVKTALAQPITLAVTATRAGSNQAVRVRSQLLDRLVNQAGEVMITRSRLEEELRQLRSSLDDLTGNLDRLRAQLRDIEVQAESQMQSRMAQAKDSGAGFDPLEFDRFTRVQELTRMMAESVNDVATVQRSIQRVVESTEDDLVAQGRQTRELQRDLLRTRMVEFEGIADRLYRVVRQAAKEAGKQVKLDLEGGSIEMDRGVLDRMTPAFEHLLRNCVAHGIESPALRYAAGKDATGSILIRLQQEGNDVSVEFTDDGAGIDLMRVRQKALEQGLARPGQQLSDAEAASLVFQPGFTTVSHVTELAGRGIGMDVVRTEVNALGGRIETATQSGQGTTFRLVLPLTTAVTQVVMIRAGGLSVGVPANIVEIVRRASADEVARSYRTGSYDFGGESLPFYWAGALLQSSARSAEAPGKTLPVVVLRSAAQRVAVHVDEVLGNQEVVVKNLGPQLSRLPGLAGMTVLASGAVVLIYNPVALAQVYGAQAHKLSAGARDAPALPQSAAQAGPAVPLVLVVDDSITVRRVTQRLLQREGYRVALANDGLQALERLAQETPAVVLSDIEMPRMDGFDLARNIRNDPRLAHLPIIMITSRIAAKHREHAMELGVNHYLGKPYSEEELLGLVKQYSVANADTA